MTLESGARLGPYHVVAPLGAGGMGEVYRARDTRLDRDVAVKVLPAAVASDPDRLARLDREARLLASLAHTNIATLFALEEAATAHHGTMRFLAMELVPGEDLTERLRRGPLAIAEAVSIARQIADALEAAHEKGIVHRDLKPANVKVGAELQVKVLDFGLAKAWREDAVAPAGEDARTMARASTAAGLIIGTPAYMSPEQACGKPVDKRADIWAFGVVLQEMLTGRPVFGGETVSETLAAVLTKDPAFSELPPATPPAIRHLLQRCLERDPRLRLRDIGEARIALARHDDRNAADPATARQGVAARRLAVVSVAVALALGAVIAHDRLVSAPDGLHPQIRFAFEARNALEPAVKVSPDGRLIAFSQATPASGRAIFLRSLATIDVTRLPGELDSSTFFWSPDSRELAIGLPRGRLVAVNVASRQVRTIAEMPRTGSFRGGDWGEDGTILISVAGTLFRVPASGGVPVPLLTPQADRYLSHGFPLFLPGARRVLVTSETRGQDEGRSVIQLVDLASPSAARVVVEDAMLAGIADDRLLFGNERGELAVVAIDPGTFTPSGTPVVLTRDVAQQVGYGRRAGFVAASLSRTGVLAYRAGPDPQSEFVWMDRTGRRLGRLGAPGPWHNFDLSADGTRVIAATRRRGVSSTLFLLHTERGVTAEVLDAAESASDPTWSPDGIRIAYRMRNSLVIRNADGGSESVLRHESAFPDSWSRDGRFIAYGAPREDRYDLFAVEVDAPQRPPVVLAIGNPVADEPRFSPSGRWVAYHASTGAGRSQVYVIPFPPTGERWQISNDEGVQPRWSPSGDELFYLDGRGRLMSVRLSGGDPRHASVPEALFETGLEPSSTFDQFAVASRGGFLVRLPSGEDPGAPVHVIVGWDR